MPRPAVESEIDRLYQLPPGEFTSERNRTAKAIGGDAGKRIRALARPSMSAWGVNQLYWRERKVYDALVAASERLRAAHRAVLAGRQADLRAADAAHREALKAALASTLRLLSEAGHAPSSAMETEVARTLESLPAGEPGRLTRPLRPGGFEALAGTLVRGRAAETRSSPAAPPGKPSPQDDDVAKRRAREQAERALGEARRDEQRAREELSGAQKRLKAAEAKAAAAKAAWERAREEEIDARDALRRAEETLERRGRERQRAEDERQRR